MEPYRLCAGPWELELALTCLIGPSHFVFPNPDDVKTRFDDA